MEGNYNEYWRRLGYEQERAQTYMRDDNIDWKEVAQHWQRIAEEAIAQLKYYNNERVSND